MHPRQREVGEADRPGSSCVSVGSRGGRLVCMPSSRYFLVWSEAFLCTVFCA